MEKFNKKFLKKERKKFQIKCKLYNTLSESFNNCITLINAEESEEFQKKLITFLNAKDDLLKIMTLEMNTQNFINKLIVFMEIEDEN